MLGVFREYRWAGVFTMLVVILAAWYLMWMFQRVIFGRAAGEPPDPHDGALTPEEREQLLHGGHGHGHGHAVPAVSGGAHDAHEPDVEAEETSIHSEHVPRQAGGRDEALVEHGGHADPEQYTAIMKDLTRIELTTLVPLLLLTVFMGVYPNWFMDYMRESLELVLQAFGSVGV
jgi:NADH-quinone oxidoreductase subunit M